MFATAAKWIVCSWIIAGLAGTARADEVKPNPKTPAPSAKSLSATPAGDAFFRGYYLETEEQDCAAAMDLYQQVLANAQADAQLRARAQLRLQGCQESVLAEDLARLVPSTTIAYVEVRRPGPQLMALLDQLGVLAPEAVTAGAAAPLKRLAISPALLREPLGLRGAALAVTGFDPMKGEPTGVGIVYFGDPAGLRAWVETALPIAGNPVEPISGFATYQIENEAFVTVTGRLAIVARERGPIELVTRRLTGREKDSLAATQEFARLQQDRGNAVLFFTVNARPIMPVLNGFLATAAIKSPEAAMAQTLLDPNSLESLSGRMGVSDAGLELDLSLQLAEGHRNLVFQFLKTPSVDRTTLQCVPAGAAAFLTAALNENSSRYSAAPPIRGTETVPVSFMDLGREIFANITTLAFFVVPAESGATPSEIPDAAVVLTVQDPERSRALWGQALGLASLASGSGTMEGTEVALAGAGARAYAMPEGVTIHLATEGRDVIVASSALAVRMALQAKSGGASVLNDPAYAEGLGLLGPDTSLALMVHPGRAMDVSRRFVSERDAEEMAPFRATMDRTLASLVIDHGQSRFSLRARVTDLPDLSGVATALIEEEHKKSLRSAQLEELIQGKQWDEAVAMIDARLAEGEHGSGLMTRKFNVLAVGKKDITAARQWGDSLYEAMSDNPDGLNTFAWNLLTEEKYAGNFAELALKCSQRSNELTRFENWMYVDTLALATFETGAPQEAIALQKKAMALSGGAGMAEMEKALARFEQAANSKMATGS